MPENRRGRATLDPATATTTTVGNGKLTAHRPEDGYTAPTAEDRREAALLAEVRELGYTVSVRCRVCSHPLTSAKSVAAHVGPKCAAKVVDQ